MKLFNIVLDKIYNWEPKEKYKSEQNYIDDLRAHLYKELNFYKSGFTRKKIKIKKQETKENCDIILNNLVGVEIKFINKIKNNPAKIGRIFNEILKNKEKYPKGIIFIIVGKFDQEIKNRIEKEIKKITELTKVRSILKQFIVNDYKIILVNKTYD